MSDIEELERSIYHIAEIAKVMPSKDVTRLVGAAENYLKIMRMVESGEYKLVPVEMDNDIFKAMVRLDEDAPYGVLYKAAIKAAPDLLNDIEGEE